MFHKLLLNFTWWVNRKDREGNNLFEGGFLGLDNIGVFDRSAPLPTGGFLEQADGTAWMALFCQNMLEIASELALDRPVYPDMAGKFVEHFLWIGARWCTPATRPACGTRRTASSTTCCARRRDAQRLKVRSMVGLLPLCAATVFDGLWPGIPSRRANAAVPERPARASPLHPRPGRDGEGGRRLASILDETKLRRVLAAMLDEDEFLSPHGIRSLSRFHDDHPYVLRWTAKSSRWPICRPNPTAACSAELELAGPGLDAGERPDRAGPDPVLPLLRRPSRSNARPARAG